MRTKKFDVSYAAAIQMALLHPEEKAALTKLFLSNEIEQSTTTKAPSRGHFVRCLDNKRVL